MGCHPLWTLALICVSGLICGYAEETYKKQTWSWPVALTIFAFMMVLVAILFKQFGIEFGKPNKYLKQVVIELLMGSLMSMIPTLAVTFLVALPGNLQNPVLVISIVVFITVCVLFDGIVGVAFNMICSNVILAWLASGTDKKSKEWEVKPIDKAILTHVVMIVILIPALFTKYRKDAKIVTCVALLAAAATSGRAYVPYNLVMKQKMKSKYLISTALFTGLCAFVSYLIFVYHRRQRQITPGLRGCKFITLAYLREMQQKGVKIGRMQDLPPRAFGNFSKAGQIIITSHRWLNRFTCDTDNIRLFEMVREFDNYYSLKGMGKGKGLKEKLWRLRCSITGGCDVLIFFDFMSIPQIGLDASGEQIPRTPEELEVFIECLPNMGLLYSSFPVIILETVPEGVAPYWHSGWCYCELNISYLGGQLDTYSSQQIADRPELAKAKENFLAAFGENIGSKIFFADSDRTVVKNIVNDFYRKKRILVAIDAKQAMEVKDTLAEIDDQERMWALLDQAIDERQNTALHVAVSTGCKEVVDVLLENGANPNLLNVRGDKPCQLFGWPRLRKAARRSRVKMQRQLGVKS
jgi:hypothetical protein